MGSSEKNAQSRAFQVGGAEDSPDKQSSFDPNSTSNVEGESRGGGVEPGGLPGGSSSVRLGFWLGGIVSQLIADAENRLGEAEECVTWYQREVEKSKRRLEDLRVLKASIEATGNGGE